LVAKSLLELEPFVEGEDPLFFARCTVAISDLRHG
jgi:hypothetical protein